MVSDRKRLIWLRGMVQTGDLEVSTIEKTTSRVLNEMLVKLFNNIMDAEEKAEDFNVIVVQECTPVPYDEEGGQLSWDKVDWSREANVVKTGEGNP